MYGTQASRNDRKDTEQFENDVKMYGTQATMIVMGRANGLRMM